MNIPTYLLALQVHGPHFTTPYYSMILIRCYYLVSILAEHFRGKFLLIIYLARRYQIDISRCMEKFTDLATYFKRTLVLNKMCLFSQVKSLEPEISL